MSDDKKVSEKHLSHSFNKHSVLNSEKLQKMSTGKYTPLNDNLHFSMNVIDQWNEIRTKSIPPRRSFHSAWIYMDYLYIYGGINIVEGKLDDFYRIKLSDEIPKWERLTTKGDLLPKIGYAASVEYKGNLYIIAGQNEELNQINTVFKIDPTTFQVEKIIIKDFPYLENHSCTTFENGIYIFGGFSKGKHCNDMYLFQPENKTLLKLEPEDKIRPTERINSSIQTFQDSIFLFGGKNSEGKYLNDIWKYSIKTNHWLLIDVNEKEPIPKGRSGHSLNLFDDELYIFGGKSGNIHENNDFWKYKPKTNQFEIVQDNLFEQHSLEINDKQTYDKDKSSVFYKSSMMTKKFEFVSAQSKLHKEKQSALDKKAKLYEDYLSSCFPPVSLMKNSNIYSMDCENTQFKRIMNTLTLKSNEMNYVSISGRVPLPRDGHSALIYRKFLVVFGGDRNKFPFNDLYTFMY